jgi:3-hydroxyisobutyrate dehydrogenase-like beta-hydroxyacid dehydrogenase
VHAPPAHRTQQGLYLSYTLSGNFLIATKIEALGEDFALTRKAGIAPDAYLELIRSVFARSPIFGGYAALIAQSRYQPAGFALRLGLKDLGLALESAVMHQAPVPVASLDRDHFLEAVARGMGNHDWAALRELAAGKSPPLASRWGGAR